MPRLIFSVLGRPVVASMMPTDCEAANARLAYVLLPDLQLVKQISCHVSGIPPASRIGRWIQAVARARLGFLLSVWRDGRTAHMRLHQSLSIQSAEVVAADLPGENRIALMLAQVAAQIRTESDLGTLLRNYRMVMTNHTKSEIWAPRPVATSKLLRYCTGHYSQVTANAHEAERQFSILKLYQQV
nr:hypothetical protein CFP56_37204 [Quercus suber]